MWHPRAKTEASREDRCCQYHSQKCSTYNSLAPRPQCHCLYIENPSTSSFWHVPEIIAWHDLSRLESVSMDYCQFAQFWRKRTRFAFSSFLSLLSLQRLCKGHKGICSRTGKPHVQPKGKCNGVNWTKIAEPYPRALCRRISQLVFRHYQLRVLAKRDKLCK